MASPPRTVRRLAALAGCLLLSLAARAGHYTVPLLVPAGTSSDPQGVLRIHNLIAESGTVEIYAFDDTGARSGPASFTLNAAAAVEFTATDLQSGNAMVGLSGGIGAEAGDTRLRIETELQIVPLAFVRAADGTLSAMHDTVRGEWDSASGQYRYRVPVFNPSTETTRVSRLRLINPGDADAAVTISAGDDSGVVAIGGDVTLTLAAGGAKTLTARQLESGDTGVTGRLGVGTGKWRLTVTADQPLQVVNVVAATAGYRNNLSTTAVPGSAPADLEALNERFVGNAVEYETRGSRFTLNALAGARYTETGEVDGVTRTDTGSYGYAAIGPDTGRLTLMYDDGGECGANLYFASPTAGWFASHCTGGEHPAEGTWLGGNWSVEEYGDEGGEVSSHAVGDALPGVPTSGAFVPAETSGGSVVTAGDGTTISLNENGYFELNDGTRYTCTAPDGCTIANGTVTAGTVSGRAAGSSEVDRFPSFRNAVGPGDRSYTVGTAIDTLTLPAASGGNGILSYTLSPSVPGLVFSAASRQLTGTPTTADTYAMTFTATDEDGDIDTLGFTIAVSAAGTEPGPLGDCHAGLMVGIGQSCTYPETADEFSVNVRGRGSFLDRLAGIRIRIRNETINGRSYYFEASHQGDGVWRIDRAGDTSPSFAEDSGPGDQTYTAGAAIDPLALPAASGGDGALNYALSPVVPGLSFDAMTRQLTGTPARADTHTMVYTVTDVDGDSDALSFDITVREPVVPDSTPEFEPGAGPGNRSYTRGTAIAPLSLPTASGGNGVLSYGLVPDVPGLSFDRTALRLTGAPTTAGTYPMTYAVTDEDGDSDSLAFQITVREPLTGGGGGSGGGGGGSGGGGGGSGGGGGGSGGGGGNGSGGGGGGQDSVGRRPGETFTDTLASGGVGPVMVVIPAGSFRMGCLNDDGECLTTDFPVHTVDVPRFALSRYEVTFEQWGACLEAGGCNGYRPHDRGWDRGDRPVMRIRWSDAQAYVAWLSLQTGAQYRLPSESEWEYAARAGTQTRYHWGSRIGTNRANCNNCGSQWDSELTAPVGSFGPNAWGLHDMHGNVLEWTQDCWNPNYTGAPTDGRAWVTGDCGARVLRSGGWDSAPRFIRAAYRGRGDPDFIVDVTGFRVARTLSR